MTDKVNEIPKDTNVAEDEQSSADSSADSDSSSHSTSTSGSTDSQTTSASEVTEEGALDQSCQSDGVKTQVNDANESNESFKSFNTTIKVDVEQSTEAEMIVATKPLQPAIDAVQKEVQSPKRVESGTDKGPVDSSVVTTRAASSSPIPITPAKSLVLDDRKVGQVLPMDTTDHAVIKMVDVEAKLISTPVGAAGVMLSPGEVFSPVVLPPKASTPGKPQADSVRDDQGKVTLVTEQHEESEHRRHKKQKGKSSKSKDKGKEDESVEEVQDRVRQLRRELAQMRKEKAKAKKLAKKRKMVIEKKVVRVKKMKTQSGGETQPPAAPLVVPPAPQAVVPAATGRIARIPQGRKFQLIAMSRAKQLGVIKPIDNQVAVTTNAIKIIDRTEFKILPTHSYRWFHRVPGTGFPHIRKLVRDVQLRYNPIVATTAKLHTRLAQERSQSKNRALSQDGGEGYTPIWSFNNDLTRSSDKPELDIDDMVFSD